MPRKRIYKLVKTECKKCGQEIEIGENKVARGRGKFCSVGCRISYYAEKHEGKNGPNWRGGSFVSAGYRYVYRKTHPNSTKEGYVKEHRVVAEKYLGRFLKKDEVVHHMNKDTLDNRIDNLEVMTQSNHMKMHVQGWNRDEKGRFLPQY